MEMKENRGCDTHLILFHNAVHWAPQSWAGSGGPCAGQQLPVSTLWPNLVHRACSPLDARLLSPCPFRHGMGVSTRPSTRPL
eukprot:scaffold28973_cov118-Isochrysis_galbana.AAC.1